MGDTQGKFDRAIGIGDETLHVLLGGRVDLSSTHPRKLRSMLHDLNQIAAAINEELMNRPG